MRVLVFTAQTNWRPHYETDLELIQRHLDEGDEIVHLHCDADLLACDDNPNHDMAKCRNCIEIRKTGISLLSRRIPSISFLNLSQTNKQELASVQKTFATIAELKNFSIEELDIGMAVLSSVISLTRNPEPDVTALSHLIARFMVAALAVYRSLQNYLDQNAVDRVYVFNGRYAPVRAVLRACQSRGVPCYVHERGHDIQHYAVEKNTTSHDLRHMQQQIRDQWERAVSDPRRNEIAEQFYIERSRGVIQSWYSFVERQKKDLLPPSWNSRRRNIAIFNSSEDEFAATDAQWDNPFYTNQLEGLQRIVRSLEADHDELHCYLRMHPNLNGVDNKHTRELYNLRRDFFEIIPPDDPVSTYALIKHADKVLTFGSTVGIEAVFWGTPSILGGRSYYQNLGGTYNPGSHEELISMLTADLSPKDRTVALMYGYYFQTFGTPFKYFRATGVVSGEFKGEVVCPRQTTLGLWKGRAKTLRRLVATQPMSAWPSELRRLWVGRKQRLRFTTGLMRILRPTKYLQQ